jgi:hypothetical protein
MAQVVEHLPKECKAPGSITSMEKKQNFSKVMCISIA